MKKSLLFHALLGALLGFITFVAIASIWGCSTPDRVSVDAFVPPDAPDAFVNCDLGTPLNCGYCGDECGPTADSCTSGACRCGDQPPCAEGRCYRGTCLTADPEGKNCEFDYQCVAGYACVNAHCTFFGCVPEVCDGFDNDCDGMVDNVGESPLAEYCLGNNPAPPTQPNPPCMSGVRVCTDGAWGACIGDVPPFPEAGTFGCDGIDNDCDSCVDGTLDPTTMACVPAVAEVFDVVFVIDVSGSMKTSIDLVVEAVDNFAGRLSTPSVRYALIIVPGEVDGTVELLLDLSSLATLQTELTMIPDQGSIEPQVDAVYMLGTGDLPLSWRPGSTRIIMVFSDEQGQSTMGVTEQLMCDSLTQGEVLVLVAEENADTIGGPPGPECADVIIPLAGGYVGSGYPCSVSTDCPEMDEICFDSACVTSAVRDMVLGLETAIQDPCD